jgi:uncharacterized protein YggT (Ycf19 family)
MYHTLKSLTKIVLGVIEFFIGLRLVLRFFGANPKTPFVEWIYDTSNPLVAPFRDMFPSAKVGAMFTVEFNALIAVLFYIFIAHIFLSLAERIRDDF